MVSKLRHYMYSQVLGIGAVEAVTVAWESPEWKWPMLMERNDVGLCCFKLCQRRGRRKGNSATFNGLLNHAPDKRRQLRQSYRGASQCDAYRLSSRIRIQPADAPGGPPEASYQPDRTISAREQSNGVHSNLMTAAAYQLPLSPSKVCTQQTDEPVMETSCWTAR